jgi:palmitoyl transferase
MLFQCQSVIHHELKENKPLIQLRFIASTFACSLLFSGNAHAGCESRFSFYELACNRINDIWDNGSHDLYLPMYTYHLRFAYDDDKIDSFREFTWGLGYGRSRYNESGNWEGIYLMALSDSHSKVQPIVGYGHQWMWGDRHRLHGGIGYTAFLTSRADIANNIPIPGILPIASINYDRFALNTAYLPGGNGNGNILFFWSRFGF